jgi:hypothetical protein
MTELVMFEGNEAMHIENVIKLTGHEVLSYGLPVSKYNGDRKFQGIEVAT